MCICKYDKKDEYGAMEFGYRVDAVLAMLTRGPAPRQGVFAMSWLGKHFPNECLERSEDGKSWGWNLARTAANRELAARRVVAELIRMGESPPRDGETEAAYSRRMGY